MNTRRNRGESDSQRRAAITKDTCVLLVTPLALALSCASSLATPDTREMANRSGGGEATWQTDSSPAEAAEELADPAKEGLGGEASAPLPGEATSPAPTDRPAEIDILDEPPYPPSGRPRAPNPISASTEDETIARWNQGSGPLLPGRTSHPAPRIRVDVIETSRRLDHLALERVARARGYWPIRLCYEEALRRTEKLHATLRIQITLAPSGAVQATRMAPSSVQDPGLLTCAGRALRKLSLPTGAGRGGVATVDISLWPGDAPIARRAKGDPPVSLPVPVQDLTASLRQSWVDLKRCYGEGLRRDANLWGRLALELEVGADGRVNSVRETESHFPGTEVTGCVERVLLSRTLSRVDRPMHFVYALRLGSLPGAPPLRRSPTVLTAPPRPGQTDAGP